MDILKIYSNQLKLAEVEFAHVLETGEIVQTPGGLPQKLRLNIIDGSMVKVLDDVDVQMFGCFFPIIPCEVADLLYNQPIVKRKDFEADDAWCL